MKKFLSRVQTYIDDYGRWPAIAVATMLIVAAVLVIRSVSFRDRHREVLLSPASARLLLAIGVTPTAADTSVVIYVLDEMPPGVSFVDGKYGLTVYNGNQTANLTEFIIRPARHEADKPAKRPFNYRPEMGPP